MVLVLRSLRQIDQLRQQITVSASPPFPHHKPASRDMEDTQAIFNSNMLSTVAKTAANTVVSEAVIKLQLVKAIKAAHMVNTKDSEEATTEEITNNSAVDGVATMDINDYVSQHIEVTIPYVRFRSHYLVPLVQRTEHYSKKLSQ